MAGAVVGCARHGDGSHNVDPARRNATTAESTTVVRGAADPAGGVGLAGSRARAADVAWRHADARDRPADLAAALSDRVPAADRCLGPDVADRRGGGALRDFR